MKVFLDVNIFMDVLERRSGWTSSLVLIQLVRNGKIEGYISALTVAILYFLRARIFREKKAKEDTKRIIRGFKIVPLTEDVITKSFDEKRIRDFEDALQFYSAKSTSDILITRNKRDFEPAGDEVELLTPEEFFRKYRYIL